MYHLSLSLWETMWCTYQSRLGLRSCCTLAWYRYFQESNCIFIDTLQETRIRWIEFGAVCGMTLTGFGVAGTHLGKRGEWTADTRSFNATDLRRGGQSAIQYLIIPFTLSTILFWGAIQCHRNCFQSLARKWLQLQSWDATKLSSCIVEKEQYWLGLDDLIESIYRPWLPATRSDFQGPGKKVRGQPVNSKLALQT